MLTKAQCRAARGLLGWTQQDLASAAGISKTAVINFERGLSDIKSETLRQIRAAFEMGDVRFGELDGVQRKAESSTIIEGPDALFRVLREACQIRDTENNDILISHLNEQEILKNSLESFYDIVSSWEKNGYKVRYLLNTGEFLFLQPFAEYRWVPEELGNYSLTTIVYGSQVAIKFWDTDCYAVIDSRIAAEAERLRFEAIWRKSKIPPVHKNKTLSGHETRSGSE
jgi:transcriptional regulator with XRE-family HTH domain